MMLEQRTMQPFMQLCMPPPRLGNSSWMRAPSNLSTSGFLPSVRFLYGKVCNMFAMGTPVLVPPLKMSWRPSLR